LEWMIKEAMAVEHPLIVDMKRLKLKPLYEGIQHDERTGWGRAWTEGTREGVRDGKGRIFYMKTSSATGSAWPRHVA
jgi:hypothetical protein